MFLVSGKMTHLTQIPPILGSAYLRVIQSWSYDSGSVYPVTVVTLQICTAQNTKMCVVQFLNLYNISEK